MVNVSNSTNPRTCYKYNCSWIPSVICFWIIVATKVQMVGIKNCSKTIKSKLFGVLGANDVEPHFQKWQHIIPQGHKSALFLVTSDALKIVPNTVVKHYWVWYDF